MGLLSEGAPLTWTDTKPHVDHVRRHGIEQFLHLYKRLLHRQGDQLKWGDEIEYLIIKMDEKNCKARLSMRAHELLPTLNKPELSNDPNLEAIWRPEYASYMIEGTPGKPYGENINGLNLVEKNMATRRKQVEDLLEDDEILVSMSIFPRLGVNPFTWPSSDATPNAEDSFTKSLWWPNPATYQGHPRFRTLTANIRQRRGEKVIINVPLYKDKNTPSTTSDAKEAQPGHIYMDAMGFGMGLSCLQVTFQACNMTEAENLYDQLAPLCPIFLALTAASPIFRGYLADVDCRWDIMEDEPSRARLVEGGVKPLMAQHISHLFIRDTVSLFLEKLNQDDTKETDHFENIQSTNWQTMRFKPPPPQSQIGWRVEFRPCELQFTDFESAAACCFLVLLTRAILTFKYNLLIPISKVDENMQRAQRRDAVNTQKFYFRTNVIAADDEEPEIHELTLNEVINGCCTFQGLLPIVEEYLRDVEGDSVTMCTLSNYWALIRKRASGELITNAAFIRQFVLNHPDYKGDSRVTEKISYDLLKLVNNIPEYKPKELFGDIKIRSFD